MLSTGVKTSHLFLGSAKSTRRSQHGSPATIELEPLYSYGAGTLTPSCAVGRTEELSAFLRHPTRHTGHGDRKSAPGQWSPGGEAQTAHGLMSRSREPDIASVPRHDAEAVARCGHDDEFVGRVWGSARLMGGPEPELTGLPRGRSIVARWRKRHAVPENSKWFARAVARR
jgi:hypothetical protein